MQLEVSAALMQVTVSAANLWVFSAVHYVHDCFYCNAGDNFCYSYVGDSFKHQFYIPFSNCFSDMPILISL